MGLHLGKSKHLGRSTKKLSNKMTGFSRAVIIDRARRDIGAKFAGRKSGKSLFSTGKSVGSAGLVFTGAELVKAKKRAIKMR